MKIWILITITLLNSNSITMDVIEDDDDSKKIMTTYYKAFYNKDECVKLADIVRDNRDTFKVEPYHVYDAKCVELESSI